MAACAPACSSQLRCSPGKLASLCVRSKAPGKQASLCAHAHVCARALPRICVRACVRACARAYARTHVCAFASVCVPREEATGLRAYGPTGLQAYTHYGPVGPVGRWDLGWVYGAVGV